jgi:hypothetical protein
MLLELSKEEGKLGRKLRELGIREVGLLLTQ